MRSMKTARKAASCTAASGRRAARGAQAAWRAWRRGSPAISSPSRSAVGSPGQSGQERQCRRTAASRPCGRRRAAARRLRAPTSPADGCGRSRRRRCVRGRPRGESASPDSARGCRTIRRRRARSGHRRSAARTTPRPRRSARPSGKVQKVPSSGPRAVSWPARPDSWPFVGEDPGAARQRGDVDPAVPQPPAPAARGSVHGHATPAT